MNHPNATKKTKPAKILALAFALLLGFTATGCGGGGGGGGAAPPDLTGNNGGNGLNTGRISIVIPGRGPGANRSASLVPSGATAFGVEVVDVDDKSKIYGTLDVQREENDKPVEIGGIPQGVVFVRVRAKGANGETLAISEDVATVLVNQATPVAAVLGATINKNSAGRPQVEPSGSTGGARTRGAPSRRPRTAARAAGRWAAIPRRGSRA